MQVLIAILNSKEVAKEVSKLFSKQITYRSNKK
jgi:hypothetical protein